MSSVRFRINFVRHLKFLQIKEGEQVLQKVWIIWFRLPYVNFESFKDNNSSPIIRFQWILHGSGVVFSEFWHLYTLSRGNQISAGNQFCRKSELFCPPFCISILKISRTQILCHSLDFNVFLMIQKSFCQTSEISSNWRDRTQFLGRTNSAGSLNLFVRRSAFQF